MSQQKLKGLYYSNNYYSNLCGRSDQYSVVCRGDPCGRLNHCGRLWDATRASPTKAIDIIGE
jgi:hypothetical protein